MILFFEGSEIQRVPPLESGWDLKKREPFLFNGKLYMLRGTVRSTPLWLLPPFNHYVCFVVLVLPVLVCVSAVALLCSRSWWASSTACGHCIEVGYGGHTSDVKFVGHVTHAKPHTRRLFVLRVNPVFLRKHGARCGVFVPLALSNPGSCPRLHAITLAPMCPLSALPHSGV